MASVTWTTPALDDLDDICRMIARHSPRHAGILAARVLRAVEHLEVFPRVGHVVPELGHDDMREVIVQSYRVIYRVLPNRVQILAVRHGARLLKDVDGV